MAALHLLARYWAWAGSNVGAMPACGAIAAGFAFIFRDRLGRTLAAWWHKHHKQHLTAELDAMEQRLKAHIDARHRELTERVAAPDRRKAP